MAKPRAFILQVLWVRNHVNNFPNDVAGSVPHSSLPYSPTGIKEPQRRGSSFSYWVTDIQWGKWRVTCMSEQLSLFRNIGSCLTNACPGHSCLNETKKCSWFKNLDSLLMSQAQDLLLWNSFLCPTQPESGTSCLHQPCAYFWKSTPCLFLKQS